MVNHWVHVNTNSSNNILSIFFDNVNNDTGNTAMRNSPPLDKSQLVYQSGIYTNGMGFCLFSVNGIYDYI